MKASSATTNNVLIEAQPYFLPEQTQSENDLFVFGYHITISNNSDQPVQLSSRHWVIIDGNGAREDIKGAGVVGQTPWIGVGQKHAYDSMCPLKTTWGTMEGTYHFLRTDGTRFDAVIARFVLAAPVAEQV